MRNCYKEVLHQGYVNFQQKKKHHEKMCINLRLIDLHELEGCPDVREVK